MLILALLKQKVRRLVFDQEFASDYYYYFVLLVRFGNFLWFTAEMWRALN